MFFFLIPQLKNKIIWLQKKVVNTVIFSVQNWANLWPEVTLTTKSVTLTVKNKLPRVHQMEPPDYCF